MNYKNLRGALIYTTVILLSLAILNLGLSIYRESTERLTTAEDEGRLAAKYKVGANANPYVNCKSTYSRAWLAGYIQQLDKEESAEAWKKEHGEKP